MNALTVGERMHGLMTVWGALSVPKRIMLIGAVAATIAVFSILARTASNPSMALLYSGLQPSAAGEVVTALEGMNVQTDVRGDSIYVPASRRDFVRMALAQRGLPQQGQAGYELLEELNGFSTTSDIFDVTYWRAMEGELARTILATPGVSAARVHIAFDRSGAFSRNRSEPKGVVTVTMGRGALDVAQANAIRYLVASSVPGLSAEQVAVLDANAGVVLSPGKIDSVQSGQNRTEERERKMEADILNILEARVGPGNARVQVALEIDTEREAISEIVYDPAGRVVSGREVRETVENSTGANASSVTVASNLPEGDAPTGGSQSTTERTQTDEILTYDLSQIRREREKAPGAIKRLSVAVLVNHAGTADADGVVQLTPRADEELAALRELAVMAVGLNEERGDTLTIQSMPFQPIENDGVAVERDAVGDFMERHLMSVIQIAVLSIVTLVLGLFVVKPLLSTKGAPEPLEPIAVAPPPETVAQFAPEPVDPVDALKGIAGERTDDAAMLIKSWLEEEETAA